MLVQGQNKRWNPAAAKMREWLREDGGIGEMLAGECRFWIRQNLYTGPDSRQPDAYVDGAFSSTQARVTSWTNLLLRKGYRSSSQRISTTGVTLNSDKLRRGVPRAVTRLWNTQTAHLSLMPERGQDMAGLSVGVAVGPFHGEDGDLRRDAGHLQRFRLGETLEDLTLQDLHPGLIEDDRLQFDAFAQAIANGTDRDWMQETTLGTWVLMEACNESARTHERVDVEAICQEGARLISYRQIAVSS